jgi:TP901 family phage tail tape measure protein|nr:MAG TPA: minor tail protein [Caudoviricetes sp.]
MGKASITIAVNAKWNGKQLDNAEKALRRLTTLSAASSKSTTADLAKQGGAWAELGGKIYNTGVKTEKVGKMLTKSVTVPLVAIGAYAGKTAIQFDTAMANVRKTTNMSSEQIEKLARSAQNLSTKQPVTAETLLNIEALGAQLGVAHDKLESFAEVTSGLDIATNMNFETAGKEMAQFANITGMSQAQFKNYGSTIVDLGNHLATTESDISNMALRLAGAGTAAKFSQADILGMSGAMSSLGIRAEAGGSAMTRIIQDISKNVAKSSDTVEEYARVAGMSADQFADAWRNRPMEAMEALVEGLKRTSDSGEDMNVTLEKLGINNIRNSDTMRRLANAGDLLRNSVDRANTAWEQNTALQNEVDQRNESLASRLQVLKNKVDAIAISIGRPLTNAAISALEACDPLIQGVGDLADAFSKMDTGKQQFVLAMVGIAAAAGPVLTVFGKIEKGVGSAITAISKGAQNFSVWKDALVTTDGAQMRAYASANLLADKMGIAGNAAAKAAGGADNYVAAWQGYYQTSQRVVDLEGKYATAVTKSATAADKAKAAEDAYKEAAKLAANADEEGKAAATAYADSLKAKSNAADRAAKASDDSVKSIKDEIDVTTKARDTYGKMVDEWSGSTKETAKVTKEIADANNKTKMSVLDSANALKQQADAAKQSGGAMKTLGSGVKNAVTGFKNFAIGLATSIGPQLAFAAAVTAIGAAVGYFVDKAAKAKEHADRMNSAMQSGESIMANAARSADGLGDAIGNVEIDADSVTQSLIDLNQSIGDTFTEVETNGAKLDQYVSTINDLAGKSNLSSTEQYRLAEAVKGYNEITGDSVSVTDAENGKLSESSQKLQENAEKWKANAEAKALASAASKYLEQEIKTQGELTLATDAYNESKAKEESLRSEINTLASRSGSLTDEQKKKLEDLTGQLEDTTKQTKDYKDKMEELGRDYTSAAEKAAYFETKAAAAHAGLDESAQNSAAKMAASMATMGDSVTKAMSTAGLNVTDLAVKMQQAGVSSEQLNSISSSNFAAMVSSCGGNIDTLVSMIQNYNNTPVVNKDGAVQVDSSTLLFANGQVVEWNGNALVYKSSGATVDYGTVVDATGAEYTYNQQGLTSKSAVDKVDSSQTKDATNKKKDYNGTPLNGKSTKDNVNSSSVDKGKKKKNEYNGTPLNGKSATDTVHHSSLISACNYLNIYGSTPLNNKTSTITVNHVDTYSKRHNAAGGIRPHAAGGVMMRYHANGAIANRPGDGVPLDIVGEAGAEAIVPLTNHKYSRPFARTIAEQMKQVGGGVSAQVVNNYTLNIDGSTIRGNDRAKELIEALVSELV